MTFAGVLSTAPSRPSRREGRTFVQKLSESIRQDEVRTDRERFSKQAAAILSALQRGPQSNKTLYTLALNATARVSELRKKGYEIRCDRLGGGLMLYTLVNA